MAKKNSKRTKPLYEAARNWAVVAARLRGGAGAHKMSSPRGGRGRLAAKRRAIKDGW